MKVVRAWARNLCEMILDASRIARSYEDIKPSVVNCTLLIVHCLGAFRLSPSGFPLYLCSLNLHPAPKSRSHFPLPSPFPKKSSQRMPLQSLTLGGCHKTNASLGLDTDLIRRKDIVIYNHPISIFICSCTFSNLSISFSHSGKSLFIHSNTSSNSS